MACLMYRKRLNAPALIVLRRKLYFQCLQHYFALASNRRKTPDYFSLEILLDGSKLTRESRLIELVSLDRMEHSPRCNFPANNLFAKLIRWGKQCSRLKKPMLFRFPSENMRRVKPLFTLKFPTWSIKVLLKILQLLYPFDAWRAQTSLLK